MAPILYTVMGSPPAGAVLYLAKVLGLELDLQQVNLLAGEHLKEDFLRKNPAHTVPVLEDDGFTVPESHAIMGYLVGKYGRPNDSLYPKNDIKRRALIDHRLHLDSSILSARGFLISKPLVLAGKKPSQEILDLLREGYSFLNKLLEQEGTYYVVGDLLSIADFSITAHVVNWNFFVKGWETDFPHLKAYIERMRKEEWINANAKSEAWLRPFFEAKMSA
uniref:Glutathione S-transferase e5 n=1 Tax=Lissorhoptrus oryzophilus TaxID=308863 RepID=A0A2R4FXH7_9CUCU|nr:glutathione S-transferase e5 [Lissorhoptrus oryzophilus]